ncbi:MAG: protease inhibitor I42 family protein [Propionicimonas sp.]|uniref:protease inhibitor I42 family protein n=1 Tax=Propionicimonas sp. TaxID=1955623 RepID=UPI003D14446A
MSTPSPEPPTTLTLAVGEQHELVLPGLGTAGYIWQDAVDGPDGVVAVAWTRGFGGDATAAPRPIGASAPERLAITAVAPGHVTLRLAQRRPWEQVAPRAQHVVEVEVVA